MTTPSPLRPSAPSASEPPSSNGARTLSRLSSRPATAPAPSTPPSATATTSCTCSWSATHRRSWPGRGALHDPRSGWLALTAHIERRLATPGEPAPLAASLPRDRVNVLLVIARPYEQDVKFRSISRPLVELADTENLPIEIHVLRPPTLGNLKRHLQVRPGNYHILHSMGMVPIVPDNVATGGAATRCTARKAVYLRDRRRQGPEPVEGRKLVELLRAVRHARGQVLNACQSGMVGWGADDPFASAAASSAERRGCSVVAMSQHVVLCQMQLSSSCRPSTGVCSRRAASPKRCVRAGSSCAIGPSGCAPAGRIPWTIGWCRCSISRPELPLDFVVKHGGAQGPQRRRGARPVARRSPRRA